MDAASRRATLRLEGLVGRSSGYASIVRDLEDNGRAADLVGHRYERVAVGAVHARRLALRQPVISSLKNQQPG